MQNAMSLFSASPDPRKLTPLERYGQPTFVKFCIYTGVLCVGFLLWLTGNILLGNQIAVQNLGGDALARLANTSNLLWLVFMWVIPIAPSLFQIFITEDWEGVKTEPVYAVSIAVTVVFDLLAPAYGAYMTFAQGLPLIFAVPACILWAGFTSLLCQHAWWISGKRLLFWGWYSFTEVTAALWGFVRRHPPRLRRSTMQPAPALLGGDDASTDQ